MNEARDFKFVMRKLNIANDQSNANFTVGNEIMYCTELLKSNLCNRNDAYNLVRGDINITGCNLPTGVEFEEDIQKACLLWRKGQGVLKKRTKMTREKGREGKPVSTFTV